MERNIFTKPFSELTADELLHLMDMVSEECDNHANCSKEGECKLHDACFKCNAYPCTWYSIETKRIIEKFREENR